MKNPLLYRSARPQSGREARERFLMETLGRTQSERRRRLALAGGFRLLRLFGIDRLDAPAALPVSVLAWGLGGRRCRSGNDFTAQLRVWCQHAVEPDQMETRAGHQGGRGLHELQRLHDDMGGAVFVRTLQLQYDLAGAVTLEPFVSDGRPGNVAAELLQFVTLIGAPAH